MELFPPLDRDEIHQATNLLEAALNDGMNDKPDSQAIAESSTERTIRDNCERQHNKYINTYNSETREYSTRLKGVLDTWKVSVVEAEETALVNDVVADGKKDIGPITSSANGLKQIGDELRDFRATHDLLHRSPVCHDVWYALLLLIIWFAAELIVTAFLLRESGGIIMVIIISVVYCFLNCFFPFLAGPFSRSINYRSGYFAWKIGGWALLLLLISIGIWLNLLMGHYRSAALELAAIDYTKSDIATLQLLVERVNDTGVRAWTNLIEAPLGITDTFSWLLAVAGFVAFVLSLREGFVRDDVYPRYGALYRRYNNQRVNYDNNIEELIDLLKTRRERGVKSVEAKKRKLVEELGRIPHLREQIRVLETKFESACSLLNRDYVELVDSYRQENRSARSTPDPGYFSLAVQLREFQPEKLGTILAPSEEQSEMMVDKLSAFSECLNEEFEALIARVRPSSDILVPDPLEISPREG